MPAPVPLYQETLQQISACAQGFPVPVTTLRRLALLVTGILASANTSLAAMASELYALALTGATCQESIERRLRRALGDRRLILETCYLPVLHQVIDWPAILEQGQRVVLIVDESSKKDQVHLFRVSLPYRGTSLPLAWAVWQQNQPLPEGQYWAQVDAVLAQVASLLPQGVEVLVLADRAYDNPPFVDRLAAYGWHFVIRCKAKSSLHFWPQRGREGPLAQWLERHLPGPGRRWKAQGRVYKKAGWRRASVVAVWAPGEKEPLVVISDLPPRWETLAWYGRRFWIEAGFRQDKSRGWQWEASRVRGLVHEQRLLVAMAWASLVALCLGDQEAAERQGRLKDRQRQARPRPPKPQPARESIFTMGLRRVKQWLYHTAGEPLRWALRGLNAPSWTAQWYHQQALFYIFGSVRL